MTYTLQDVLAAALGLQEPTAQQIAEILDIEPQTILTSGPVEGKKLINFAISKRTLLHRNKIRKLLMDNIHTFVRENL